MEATDIEDLQLEVIQALCTLSKDDLVDFCNGVDIAGCEFERVQNKSQVMLIMMISSHLQRQELGELEDQGTSQLLYIRDIIQEYPNVRELSASENVLQAVLQAEIKQNEVAEAVNQNIE
ncbi:hypothetical protein AMECASPLE_032486 [Ameca splendens]|uniref:Uncharacterized protein n=1 Tax=Ameca splendens TaxID=208324 RepID=A0ABV0YHM2_9TELE